MKKRYKNVGELRLADVEIDTMADGKGNYFVGVYERQIIDGKCYRTERIHGNPVYDYELYHGDPVLLQTAIAIQKYLRLVVQSRESVADVTKRLGDE